MLMLNFDSMSCTIYPHLLLNEPLVTPQAAVSKQQDMQHS